jgi:hypothetical protein
MPSNEEYYADVQNVVDEIIVTVSEQTLQPKDRPRRDPRDKTKWDKTSGAVYIVSVKNREVKEHRAGVVAIAPYWLAAKGIVDRLHEVASDKEIEIFLKEQAEKKFAIERGLAQTSGVAQFRVPPVNEGVK